MPEIVVDVQGNRRHRGRGEVDDAGALVGDDDPHRQTGVDGPEAQAQDQEQQVLAHISPAFGRFGDLWGPEATKRFRNETLAQPAGRIELTSTGWFGRTCWVLSGRILV